jgi:hypothetical protein
VLNFPPPRGHAPGGPGGRANDSAAASSDGEGDELGGSGGGEAGGFAQVRAWPALGTRVWVRHESVLAPCAAVLYRFLPSGVMRWRAAVPKRFACCCRVYGPYVIAVSNVRVFGPQAMTTWSLAVITQSGLKRLFLIDTEVFGPQAMTAWSNALDAGVAAAQQRLSQALLVWPFGPVTLSSSAGGAPTDGPSGLGSERDTAAGLAAAPTGQQGQAGGGLATAVANGGAWQLSLNQA